ncbi:hypothetical protein ACWEJ6_51440 [Nonomuraea sp. NPDC004702]
MAKLIENLFRFVNVSLVNEVATPAALLGVNIWEVIDAAAAKPFGSRGSHCVADGLDGRMVTLSVTSGHASQKVSSRLGIATSTATVSRAPAALARDVPVRLEEAIYPHQLVKGTPTVKERRCLAASTPR